MLSDMAKPELRRRLTRLVPALVLPLMLWACASAPVDEWRSDTEQSLDRADQQRRLADYSGAQKVYERILTSPADPADEQAVVRARLGRADCRLNLGMNAAGRLDAQMALSALRADELDAQASLAPLLAEAEQLLGDAELAAGRSGVARPHYTRAMELVDSPTEQDLLWYRLYLCARQENRPDAGEMHSKVRERVRPEYVRLDARFLNVQRALGAPLPELLAAPAQVATTSASGLHIRSRTTWRAASPRANRDRMTRINRVTLHHSGTKFDSLSEEATAGQLRSIQRYHQASNGWADIAYHYVIDPAGRIWEGRDLRWQGAHAGNHELNLGNIGVCILGDYEVQRMSHAQTTSLYRLLQSLRDEHGVPKNAFYTHREIREANHFGSTLCPGHELTLALDRFRTSRTGLLAGP